MKEYKYSISMTYIHGNDIIEIKSENIKALIIDNDYINNNMPKLFSILMLDKNITDKIILNASAATIRLDIYKFVNNSDVKNIELYIRDEFLYFISKDINYYKDIDYMGENKNREDIYQQVYIGLISKKAVEYNNKNFNTTITGSMMSIVSNVTSHIPMLIEPFTYNKNITQLIAPPLERVSKTLGFLNSISVFYDTPYRFYIDFDTAYLISSSGNVVQKKKDLYSSVIISMHNIDGKAGDVVGMYEDSENKCYKVDINVIDSYYNIDKNVEKNFNNLAAILDISRDKTKKMTTEISNAMRKVTNIMNNVNSTVNRMSTTVNSALRMMTNNLNLFNGEMYSIEYDKKEEFNLIISNLKIAIDSAPVPEPQLDPEGNPILVEITDREELKRNIDVLAVRVNEYLTSNTASLKSAHASIYNKILDNFVTTTHAGSYINGVTPINIKDNLNGMTSLVSDIEKENISIQGMINTEYKPSYTNINLVPSYIQIIISEVEGSTPDLTSDSTISTEITKLQNLKSELSKSLSNINTYSNSSFNSINIIPNFTNDINNNIKEFINVDVDLKGKFLGINSELNSLNSKAKNILTSISNNLNVSNINSAINIKSLASIKDDLDKFRDISSIGDLGISKFESRLNLEGMGSQKDKIIRVTNDNANMIKNIKAKVESSSVKLSLNKNGLDSSVFTINKEYIVKNYDTHDDRDGRFILIGKKEIYIRENENFVGNIMLDFNIVKN